MPARYWRITGIRTYSGGDLELAALQMSDANGRVDVSAVITSSHAPTSGTLSQLQSNGAAGSIRFASASTKSAGFFIVWDFGTPVELSNIRLFAADSKSAFLGLFSLEQLVDGRWLPAMQVGWNAWPGAHASIDVAVTSIQSSAIASLIEFATTPLSGSQFTDLKSNTWQLNSSYVGDTSWGRALVFNGNGYGDTADRTILDFGAADFTAECWFRPDIGITGQAYGGWLISNDNTSAASTRAFAMQVLSDGSVGCNFFIAGVNYGANSVAGRIEWGRPSHLEAGKKGSTIYLFLNGTLVATSTAVGALASQPSVNVTLGANPAPRGGTNFVGQIFGYRVTKGLCRHTANFKPPVGPTSILIPSPDITPARVDGLLAHSELLPSFSLKKSRALNALDTEFGGQGVYPFEVEGLTGSQKARVMLMRARDGLIARELWSGADGKGEFIGLDVNTRFIAVGQDPSGLLHPVGASHSPVLRVDLP